MNLFVVGNGFDIAHGLKTSYIDFRCYLEEQDWDYLRSLEEMYGFTIESKQEFVENYLWRDFEKNLSLIDETHIIENGESIELGLESEDIGVEDTLNEYWEDQYGFIQRLNEFIKLWIKQVNIDADRKTNRISADTNDLFITFNYTLLLEKVYKVDKYNILHIHGSIDEDYDLSPVIGHGDYSKVIEMKRISEEVSEEFHEKKCSIYNAVANYYDRTFKDVKHFLGINKYFFKRLKNIEEISIIGHSLGDVDMPYFKEIKRYVKQDSIWNIYYYDKEKATCFKNKIISIGVDESNIRMLRSQDFFK
ncbi:Bacteriophage abortive infection AbiH [Peptoclostridium litorale DSM 5388]|uniref:Abortive phage resistance mechanism n=1 Tax=Peptoclostridium litorale DSM 5388 TaxID=1121324 RepID=A0A069RBA3_PEPLI|nr:bacteriophage abortive infection AbiH family protein [Peptoclostridium litorale]KDR94349.1 abortive phage resistance mechanism [Peptoclostridium litorale DSM 5388]SIO37920.1 Bacteriophage abortive infection AbiH [Peptoclostridium litorale DSM 5388]